MNMLRKVITNRVVLPRFIGTANNGPANAAAGKRLIIEPLSGRELIRVQGDEVVPFLQGLITNDLANLQSSTAGPASMYSMFLNKAGRVLYDSIIYRTQEPSTYLVECDTSVADELRRHLRLYRVRRKIQIDAVADVYQPWVVFKPDVHDNAHIDVSGVTEDIFATPDPRIRDLGLRVITGKDKSWQDLASVFTKSNHHIPEQSNDECNYRLHRYRYGVGEGMDELPPGKSFPLEANGDYLQGVSFQKGCYIGQELTARVYHTGVIRKRLMPLQLSAPVTTNATAVLLPSGANVGIIRGSIGHNALALMRVEKVINGAKLMVEETPCYAVKPKWWPSSTEQASAASKCEAA